MLDCAPYVHVFIDRDGRRLAVVKAEEDENAFWFASGFSGSSDPAESSDSEKKGSSVADERQSDQPGDDTQQVVIFERGLLDRVSKLGNGTERYYGEFDEKEHALAFDLTHQPDKQSGPRRRTTYTDEQKERVLELYKAGLGVSEIAEKTGVKRASAYNVIRSREE